MACSTYVTFLVRGHLHSLIPLPTAEFTPYEIAVARAQARALETPPENPFAQLGPAASFSLLLNLVPYLSGKMSLEDVAAGANAVEFIDESAVAQWFHRGGLTRADGNGAGVQDLPGWTSRDTVSESRPSEVREDRVAQEILQRIIAQDRPISEMRVMLNARQTSESNKGLVASNWGNRDNSASSRTPAVAQTRTVRGSSKPASDEALVGNSTRQMNRAVQKKLRAEPHNLLRFILGENGKLKPTRGLSHAELIDDPDLVQMGHIASKKGGATERIMLQSAWENQVDNLVVEMSHFGAEIVDRVAVLIDGFAVSRSTAQYWESIGRLPPGTVSNAPIMVDH